MKLVMIVGAICVIDLILYFSARVLGNGRKNLWPLSGFYEFFIRPLL